MLILMSPNTDISGVQVYLLQYCYGYKSYDDSQQEMSNLRIVLEDTDHQTTSFQKIG